MTLPVLVERSDPSKIVHDPSRPAVAGSPFTGSTGGGAVAQTMSAADVIARGIPSQGVLHTADPTGMTAGQVLTSLPSHEADDPLVRGVHLHPDRVRRAAGRDPRPGARRQRSVAAPRRDLADRLPPRRPDHRTIDWSHL